MVPTSNFGLYLSINSFCDKHISNLFIFFTSTHAETQRMGNSHLRKVSVSESNVLLDEEVLTDPKIQALLLTVLVSMQTSTPSLA